MSSWKAKRFWDAATVEPEAGGWRIALDGKPVKTPAKQLLVVPTRPLALSIAAEWDAQEGEVDPTSMPLTRSANSALDKVTPQKAEVAKMLAQYGGTDLLCYRALDQESLQKRQEQIWDPLLTWAAQRFGARLNVGAGVMHVAQPPEAVAALAAPLDQADPFALTALHDLIALSGSLVIALAVIEGQITVDKGWAASRLDDDYQAQEWGIDEEAAAHAALKATAFRDAYRFWHLSHLG